MQATKLHTQDAVLQLHPRSGGCSGIRREKRPFTTPTHTSSSSFWPGRGKERTIHTLVIWLLWLYEPRVGVCWLFLGALSRVDTQNSQPAAAAAQMNTTTTRVHINTLQTFTLRKHKKQRKCTEMTCSLSSHTIALSFIYPELHRKLRQILNRLLWARLVLITGEDFTIAAAGRRILESVACNTLVLRKVYCMLVFHEWERKGGAEVEEKSWRQKKARNK